MTFVLWTARRTDVAVDASLGVVPDAVRIRGLL